MNAFMSLICSALISVSASAAPANGTREEKAMVSNGQGVSSPSFWSSLSAQNPAGLILNDSIKLQLGAASYGSTLSDKTYGSGGLLIGNTVIGAGLEYQGVSGTSRGKLNWGVGGYIPKISTAVGLSSHSVLNGGETSYHVGALIDPLDLLRIGIMVPDFTHGIGTIAGGITWRVNGLIDFVVDADYNTRISSGTLKPGITLSLDRIQASFAHGIRYAGNSNAFLREGVTAGVAVRVLHPLLVSYEYQGFSRHHLGLTLRFN